MVERFESTPATEVITEFALALTTQDSEGWKPLGTAVFISQHLLLTAKHVVEGIWKPHHLHRSGKLSDSALIAYQVLPGAVGALWHAKHAYFSTHTDLVLLDIFPYSESAPSYRPRKLEINFAPPCVGEDVLGFGYMGGHIQASSDSQADLTWHANPRTTAGTIAALHHERRDRGFCKYPCFEMTAHTEPGMSGGPLFDERGRLCGLVYGGGLARKDGTSIRYGTLLWPLLLLEGIKGRFEGEPEQQFSFYQLVQRGAIAATGLDALSIEELEDGRLRIGPRESAIHSAGRCSTCRIDENTQPKEQP